MSVQPHLDRELTDCTPFGSSLQSRFGAKPSTSFGLFFVTMFIRHSHWLTIPSSLAPRQNDVICLNLHSRFGLFLSERVLCQSSFAQRDYSQCTYSQTTANGIAGVINELNYSHTITYTAFTCHTSSRSAPLLGLSPLRTVHESFPSHGSSNALPFLLKE